MALEMAGDTLRMQMKNVGEKLQKIGKRIAVMSGKGGVGKTTVAVNIAALLAKNHSVLLLDADIDCPNIGKMLGIEEKFKVIGKNIMPVRKYNMDILSMAFFDQPEDRPMIWRGPMIHHALMQLIELSEHGDYNYLVIDMPPGTSDATLTVMQTFGIDFAVIVTSPQEIAVMDAKKSANTVRQFGKPFGILENMTGDVFGEGSGKKAAEEMNAPYLGTIPLAKEIRESCDSHVPIVLESKEYERIFQDIVKKIEA